MVRPIWGSLSGPKRRKPKTKMIASSVDPIPNKETSNKHALRHLRPCLQHSIMRTSEQKYTPK